MTEAVVEQRADRRHAGDRIRYSVEHRMNVGLECRIRIRFRETTQVRSFFSHELYERIDERKEARIEEQQSNALDDDCDSSANAPGTPTEQPRRDGERCTGGDVANVESDVQPEKAIELRGTLQIPQRECPPGVPREHEIDETPAGSLKPEVEEKCRAEARATGHGEERQTAYRARHTPEKKALQMRSLVEQEGIRPHRCGGRGPNGQRG
jgi:hypothetical protein